MALKKKGTCTRCKGQLLEVTAQHLKDKNQKPLIYGACPGDCAGTTRQDIAAGKAVRA